MKMDKGILIGAAVVAAIIIAQCTNPETPLKAKPAPPPQAAQEAAGGADWLAGASVALGTQLHADKAAQPLHVDRNGGLTLWDTPAIYPGCEINGKPMMVASARGGGFTCYRWVGSQVALRKDAGHFAMLPGDTFLAR